LPIALISSQSMKAMASGIRKAAAEDQDRADHRRAERKLVHQIGRAMAGSRAGIGFLSARACGPASVGGLRSAVGIWHSTAARQAIAVAKPEICQRGARDVGRREGRFGA
jgi:hypothetical protein